MIKKKKKYIIALNKKRSIIALIASSIAFVFTFTAVVHGLLEIPSELTPERGSTLFHLFTVNSNLLSAVGAAFMIPFAVEGIRKKRFVVPEWLTVLQFSGVITVSLTMLLGLTIIWIVQGRSSVTGMNLWLHIVCPVMAIVLFLCVDTDVKISWKSAVIAMIPFLCYALLYLIMVFILGVDRGGWRDIYRMGVYVPYWAAAVIMTATEFGFAALYRAIHNRLADRSEAALTAGWAEDLSPVELKIEAFGLGSYMGEHTEFHSLDVPLDIFRLMSRRYDIPEEELIRAYTSGYIQALDERQRARRHSQG